jgi:serine/threonine protein phosphatase PrpC
VTCRRSKPRIVREVQLSLWTVLWFNRKMHRLSYNEPLVRDLSLLSSKDAADFPMTVDGMKVKPGMEVASLTDVGRQRDNNEDSFLYWEPESDDEVERKGRLAVIADGMGGYEGGHEASRLAVETVVEVYRAGFGGDPRATLVEAFAEAHKRIQEYAEDHPAFQGMGTTCTALAVVARQLYFAHVGDSRLYLVRGGEISRLTRDHTYVGRLVESGIVRAEDAETHPQRHILTAALGSGSEVAVDFPQQPLAVEQGDTFVLCTDGLWGLVTDAEILKAVNGEAVAAACQSLVATALVRGGPDNITVQLLRVGQPS